VFNCKSHAMELASAAATWRLELTAE